MRKITLKKRLGRLLEPAFLQIFQTEFGRKLLHTFVRHFRPKRVIEIGSGYLDAGIRVDTCVTPSRIPSSAFCSDSRRSRIGVMRAVPLGAGSPF